MRFVRAVIGVRKKPHQYWLTAVVKVRAPLVYVFGVTQSVPPAP